jgi:hypothetical protein
MKLSTIFYELEKILKKKRKEKYSYLLDNQMLAVCQFRHNRSTTFQIIV